MSELVARRLVIRGLVQGVGYRFSMMQAAQEHGVTGWVRNRRDGCVEAVVKGRGDAVAAMIAWARRGPRGARVDDVEEHAADGDYAGFEQRPTV
jgi:acylphosphatase